MTTDVKLTPETTARFLVESNKNFALNIQRFQPIMDALFDGEPFLFHCTAGKDRTGMSASRILTAPNVDRDAIMNDYLLTNKYTIPYYRANKEKTQMLAFDDNVINEPGGVKEEYPQAAFNTIDSIYGNSATMLEKEFGITPKKRQELIKKYTY
jgi:protein-tyrosine phosphatase